MNRKSHGTRSQRDARGHNADGGRAIANAVADLEERVSRPLVLVVGMLSSKDCAGFLNNFTGLASRIVAVPIADQDKAVAAENQFVASGLGWICAVSGRRADALKIAQEFRDLSSHAYVDFYLLATIYAGLGEKDEVFRLLEKGYEQRSASMSYITIDPFWYGMRSDPRYADLLRRMGLPQ